MLIVILRVLANLYCAQFCKFWLELEVNCKLHH